MRCGHPVRELPGLQALLRRRALFQPLWARRQWCMPLLGLGAQRCVHPLPQICPGAVVGVPLVAGERGRRRRLRKSAQHQGARGPLHCRQCAPLLCQLPHSHSCQTGLMRCTDHRFHRRRMRAVVTRQFTSLKRNTCQWPSTQCREPPAPPPPPPSVPAHAQGRCAQQMQGKQAPLTACDT